MIVGKPFVTTPVRASKTSGDHRWADAVAGLRQRYKLLGDCIRWFMDINPKGTSRPMQQLIGVRREAMIVLQELMLHLDEECLHREQVAMKLLQQTQMLRETNRRIDALVMTIRKNHPSFHHWMAGRRSVTEGR